MAHGRVQFGQLKQADTQAHSYKSLDGVRGLASLVVVLWHFALAFMPFAVGYQLTGRHTPFDEAISSTPLFLVVAGSFSVTVFFVLSGFVLSLSFFKYRTRAVLASSAARRYFRLMIPAAGSIVLAFLVMSVAHQAHTNAAGITGSSWLGQYWNDPAHFGSALYQGLYGVFFTGHAPYNTNLWTMQIELFGSLIVFTTLALFGDLRARWFGYALMAAVFLKTYYVAFILGVVLCDVWHTYPAVWRLLSGRVMAALAVVGIFLGSWHETSNAYPSAYDHLGLPFFSPSEVEILAQILAAGMLIVCVLRLRLLSRFFESRPLQYLGRLSFSLYLLHFLVIYSFSSFAFAALFPHAGYATSVWLTVAGSLPVMFAAAHAYSKWVDTPSIGWSKAISGYLLPALNRLTHRSLQSRTVYSQPREEYANG